MYKRREYSFMQNEIGETMDNIEEFIENFRTREENYVPESEEAIRHLFRSGYCYYFAKILEAAFPGGDICLAYPYGHIVYFYEDKIYDIEGISTVEAEHIIPIRYIDKEYLECFMHRNVSVRPVTEDHKRKIAKAYNEVLMVNGVEHERQKAIGNFNKSLEIA